ncbi:MAG: hypothetical protein CVU41_15910 [Chloroflexi bacterium HGW-Chloroflexi-3]|nr:MAG: hypothetical protein CVU41_15910 [Chloroflexi bacterium HGW-Chloroflexi-3]
MNIAPQDPFSLILVNDSQQSEEDISFDNSWEIQYEGGELGGISLYSTLGLQALSLRITPIFSNLNESRINLRQFEQKPNINEILPNYTNISVEVFAGIHFSLEYFISNSYSIYGQVSIQNKSSQKFSGNLQYLVSLKPLSGGEQMRGMQSDLFYVLEGKTKDLFPVFYLSGPSQTGKLGQTSIASILEIDSDSSQNLKWCLAFEHGKFQSLESVVNFQSLDFDKETTRNKLFHQRDFFFFDTGNPEWDNVMLFSQNSAKQLIVRGTESQQKLSLVQNRHPEKTIFQSETAKIQKNEGISPIQLWYFLHVLPKQHNLIHFVFDEFLFFQREDGFIPNHSDPSNFLARFHAFPILATIGQEILDAQRSQDLAIAYLHKLISYLQYWLSNFIDKTSYHWENALQSLYEDLPIHNLWDKEGYGINIRWIESPFLNSLLVIECEKCLQIADQFKIDFPERNWLESQKTNLVKNIDDSWNPKQKYFAYRDIQTKKSPGKVSILKKNGSGIHMLEKNLQSPQRLTVRVITHPELSRKITVEIRGMFENQEVLEIIRPRNFIWSTTTGLSTTENVFESISSINILGLPDDNSVEVSTSQYSMVDLSLFLSILIKENNKIHIQQMVDQWLEKEFLSNFGLSLIPKKYLATGKTHTNSVDLPLNSLILEGLIDNQQLDLAKKVFINLMKVVIKNLRLSKKFYKLYDAHDGTCKGEYNIINGMIPLKIFFRLIGIHRWTENEIEFMGSSVFKEEIKIFHRGLKVICSQKGHMIITSDGKIIELNTTNLQKIKIPS